MSEIINEIQQFFKQQDEMYPDDFYFVKLDSSSKFHNTVETDQDIVTKSTSKLGLHLAENEMLFNSGNENASIVFVVVKPEQSDIDTDQLLSGEAGILFDKILNSINLNRDKIFITSLRTIDKDTKLTNRVHKHQFQKHILKVKPKLIVSLGHHAGNIILEMENHIDVCHGKIYEYLDTKLIYTYHPELVRHDATLKRPVWEDFKKIRDILNN